MATRVLPANSLGSRRPDLALSEGTLPFIGGGRTQKREGGGTSLPGFVHQGGRVCHPAGWYPVWGLALRLMLSWQ
ncbi:hypothetical protein [Gluconobacter japonicus]|uniref:hypothetical protein n=1 Tax=Gluconobacter japonicus TaxID=376620 RepID=UPI0018D2F5CE|nr:hypothetical protein [Gluconobacter japonicus]